MSDYISRDAFKKKYLWDILEFTYVLNTLAVQHLLEDKEDKDDDD